MKPKHSRRNYYRILQVQPDAAPDVIKASYRTIMQKLKYHPDLGGDDWDASVINQAYTVLSDPSERAQYDAEQSSKMMGVGETQRSGFDASDDSAVTARNYRYGGQQNSHTNSAFDSLVCVLCQKLTNVPKSLPGPRCCHACNAPLPRANNIVPDTPGQRAIPRLERHAPVRWRRTDEPRHEYRALLEDLSPQGMRLSTDQALEPGELLHIDCELLLAIARVIVSRADDNGSANYVIGTEFVTVEFKQRQGSLIATRA